MRIRDVDRVRGTVTVRCGGPKQRAKGLAA
jgi:hypothetical protein